MRHLLIITLFFLSLTVLGQARDRDAILDHKQEQKQERQQEQKQLRREERMLNNDKANRIPEAITRIKLVKTAYMTKRLDLTPEQNNKFWPLYNHYQEELFVVQRQIRINNSPLQTNGKDQIMNKLALDDKKTSIERFYANEFLKIMPPEKLSLLYKSEKDFNDEALKRLKDNRNEINN